MAVAAFAESRLAWPGDEAPPVGPVRGHETTEIVGTTKMARDIQNAWDIRNIIKWPEAPQMTGDLQNGRDPQNFNEPALKVT